MAVTDAELKATIKRLFSEDLSTEDSGASLLDISDDPIQLDGVIDKVLPDAVAQCSVASPRGGVNPVSLDIKSGASFTPAAIIDDEGVVTLPADYIRMNWMKLTSPAWSNPVYTVEDPTSTLAKAQYNSYTASWQDNPVVVSTTAANGKGLIAFPHDVTSSQSAVIGTICYDKKYVSTITSSLATDNPDYVMAVCHMAVSLLYEVFERGDAAERHKAIALGLLGAAG